MLLEKARLKLVENIAYVEDLQRVKKAMVERDFNLMSLSMYEVEGLWSLFSSERCASFYIVSEDSLESFFEWLD